MENHRLQACVRHVLFCLLFAFFPSDFIFRDLESFVAVLLSHSLHAPVSNLACANPHQPTGNIRSVAVDGRHGAPDVLVFLGPEHSFTAC